MNKLADAFPKAHIIAFAQSPLPLILYAQHQIHNRISRRYLCSLPTHFAVSANLNFLYVLDHLMGLFKKLILASVILIAVVVTGGAVFLYSLTNINQEIPKAPESSTPETIPTTQEFPKEEIPQRIAVELGTSSGTVKDIVSNNSKEFYIDEIIPTDTSGKIHYRSYTLVCKNKKTMPDLCIDPLYLRLVTTEGNEYSPKFLSNTPRILPNDVIRARLSFEISGVPQELVYDDGRDKKIIIDLNSTKEPADVPPRTEWKPTADINKVKLNDERLELTFDACIGHPVLGCSLRYGGFVINASIKNLSKEPVKYNEQYFYFKNVFGTVKSAFVSALPEIGTGTLHKGGKITGIVQGGDRGDMIIYDEPNGSYFVTAEPSTQEKNYALFVDTEKENYAFGDKLVVYGWLVNNVWDQPVTIEIIAPDATKMPTLTLFPKTISGVSDKRIQEFLTDVPLGSSFKLSGTYTVKAIYLRESYEARFSLEKG
jgi:hypothetical protein